jgi:hypothetical protein
MRAAKMHQTHGLPDSTDAAGASSADASPETVKDASSEKAISTISDVTPSPAASPRPDLTPLIAALSTLATTRRNTSTTRTSLLSTLEAYTSALHRQMWNPTPSDRWGGVGLNSLDRHLGAAGAGAGGKKAGAYEFEGVIDRREEWDAVRKEVRAVKGMLLGRRTFA